MYILCLTVSLCREKGHYHNTRRPSNQYGNHLISGYVDYCYFFPALFSPQIRWINKTLDRALFREFSECPQRQITYSLFSFLIHALHLSVTYNIVNVCKQHTLFSDLIRVKQPWLEINTETSTALSGPYPLFTSKYGNIVLFQNKLTSLNITWKAHLTQSIRFELTSKTTDYRFPQHDPHHTPPLSQLPSKQNSWLILNSCVLLVSYRWCVRSKSCALHRPWPYALNIAWSRYLCWLLLL